MVWYSLTCRPSKWLEKSFACEAIKMYLSFWNKLEIMHPLPVLPWRVRDQLACPDKVNTQILNTIHLLQVKQMKTFTIPTQNNCTFIEFIEDCTCKDVKIYQELSHTSQASPHNQPGWDSVLTEPKDSHKDRKATERKNVSLGSCSFTLHMS